SCDLTMRGGTTSGVAYPLAVCALAQHYVFRSVGGASAGAIAASATAAAEVGRASGRSAPGGDGSGRPGVAGPAEVIEWLTASNGAGAELWRLAQLFQPGNATRPAFRMVAASLQSAATTKRSKAGCLAVATLSAVGALSRILVTVLLAIWLLGPLAAVLLLPAQRWATSPRWAQWTVVGLAGVLLGVATRAVWRATATGRQARQTMERASGRTVRSALRTRVGIVGVAVAPLVLLALVAVGYLLWATTHRLRPVLDIGPWPGLAYAAKAAGAVLGWLALTLAVLMAFILMYGMAMTRLVQIHGQDIRFGLVPGAQPVGEGRSGPREWLAARLDRWSGMPARTGVPPLS